MSRKNPSQKALKVEILSLYAFEKVPRSRIDVISATSFELVHLQSAAAETPTVTGVLERTWVRIHSYVTASPCSNRMDGSQPSTSRRRVLSLLLPRTPSAPVRLCTFVILLAAILPTIFPTSFIVT